MRRCPLRFLAKSVRILHDNPYTNPGTARADDETSATSVKEENVLQSAVQVLQRRWIEAINGSDFISLFQVIDLLDDEKKLKLEERAADVVHQFSAAEMIKVTNCLVMSYKCSGIWELFCGHIFCRFLYF